MLFDSTVATIIAAGLFVFGIGLNLWTLQALGIKGMYNGDSFGWLMDAPVTNGPFAYFNDPQYVGTTAAILSSGVYYQSLHGYRMLQRCCCCLLGISLTHSLQYLAYGSVLCSTCRSSLSRCVE